MSQKYIFLTNLSTFSFEYPYSNIFQRNEKIKLPIEGKTQSLNVSVACGAILYEAMRQKILVSK